MQEVLLVIHLIIALAIIAIVLIQPSESGGFLGNSGTMSNIGAPRRSADVLTRSTNILAGIFFTTSLLLAISAGHRPASQSILDAGADAPAALTAPAAEVTPEPKAPISK